LPSCRNPLAFEIVGANDEVAFQFTSSEADERLLHSALRSHFPDVVTEPYDHVTRAFRRDDFGFADVLELGLQHEFMLPLASARSFDPDPLIAVVAALEDTGEDEAAVARRSIELAPSAHMPGRHLGVALDVRAPETLSLDLARRLDPLANRFGRFDCDRRGDLVARQCGDLDLQVDAVEQRTGNFREIPRDLLRAATAFAPPVIEESAGTLIRRDPLPLITTSGGSQSFHR
jgi:hypothetical protein